MSDARQNPTAEEGDRMGIMEDEIFDDLRSTYAGVRCPVHDVPPGFEREPNGSIVEAFCCEVLAQIFRELRADEEREDDAGSA
jgi:hypothetical protein